MTTKDLLEKYAISYFRDQDFLPPVKLADKGDREKARLEYIANPGAVFLENIEAARHDVEGTARRLENAKRDGLLNRDTFEAATKKQKAAWVACIEVVKGDHDRARSEVKHWREYAALAIAGTLPMPKQWSLEALAISKAVKPIELTDAEVNAARNKAAADLAEFHRRNPSEPDRRLPPEADDEPPF